MLQLMCGVTCKDNIRNEHKREASASKKITERRLDGCGHVMRRYEELILRKVSRTDKPGKMKRGRPITRWNDACQCDVESTGLRAGEEMDRAPWSRKIFSHTGDPMTGEDEQYFFKINWGSGLISSRSLTDPSNVHVLPTIFFYQHIVHVDLYVVYNHQLCLCDVHLQTI